MALRQISDAICDHLAHPEPARPLVLSLHGPPGVGKSMFHLLAAHALYNRQPERRDLRCPGLDCAGYKVGAGCAGRGRGAMAPECNGRARRMHAASAACAAPAACCPSRCHCPSYC